MLYDQRWDAKTKARPCSLEGFIAWLETKNPDERYEFSDCNGRCLIGQYMASVGISWGKGRYPQFCGAIGLAVATSLPQTFGAALTRARAVLTERAGA